MPREITLARIADHQKNYYNFYYYIARFHYIALYCEGISYYT